MISTDRLLRLPIVRSHAGPVFRRTVLDTPLSGAYWRVAPAVHRRRRHRSSGYVDPPIDPFERVLVDPDRIERITGREYPVWTDLWADFGAVRGGDWDVRERPPVSSSYDGPDPSLYLADSFEATPIHEALEAHFVDGVPWKELAFVEAVKRRTEGAEEGIWHECSSESEIRQFCDHLDRLYRDMRERGCLSAREVNARENERLTFREAMEEEITVDVGRDGEPLFVTGRHRLSIAKILGLDRIPVALVVRHPEWLRNHGGTGADAVGPRPASKLGDPLDARRGTADVAGTARSD